MTVGEKSTELGYSLADAILATNPIKKHMENGAFCCFKIGAPIIADENQGGSTENFYYFKSEGLAEDATKTEIETAYKTWLEAQPYTEKTITVTDEVAFPE